MRWLILPSVVLALWGCGVPKNVWLKEIEQREGFEKQLAICQAAQRAQQREGEALQRELADTGEKLAAARADLADSRARSDDLQDKLTAAIAREQGVRSGLETCEQARLGAERETERLRGSLSGESEARAAASGKVEEVAAERNRLRDALDAEKSRRMEDVARGRELATELDLLRASLGEEKRRAAGASAEAEELKTRVAGMEGRLAAVEEERERLEREKAAKLAEVERGYEELLEGMKSELEKGQVTISQLRGKLSVNVLDEILFPSGRAEINAQGQQVLGRVGEVLSGMGDKAIVIEGHTDSVPVTGALAKVYASNWELSAARATSVVRYLQANAGIAPGRLSAVGLGPHHPVDTNDTSEGRARNRRIEIKLVPLEQEGEGEAAAADQSR